VYPSKKSENTKKKKDEHDTLGCKWGTGGGQKSTHRGGREGTQRVIGEGAHHVLKCAKKKKHTTNLSVDSLGSGKSS